MYTIAAVQNDLTVVRSEFPTLDEALLGARRAALVPGASGVVRIYDENDRLVCTHDFIPF